MLCDIKYKRKLKFTYVTNFVEYSNKGKLVVNGCKTGVI